jgi:hypothetical protein
MTADLPAPAPPLEIHIAVPSAGAAPAVELRPAEPGDIAAIERDLDAIRAIGIRAHRHREHSIALAPIAARYAAELRGYYGVPARELTNGEIIEWALLGSHRGGLPADAGAVVQVPPARRRGLDPITTAAIAATVWVLVLILLGHAHAALAVAVLSSILTSVSAARRR